MKITFRTALITGSSRGLGRAIAVKLAQEGVKKIAVHYLTRKDEADKTLAQIRDSGADGVLVQGDTSDAKRSGAIVEEAAEELGGCDIFVQSVVPKAEERWRPVVGVGHLERWPVHPFSSFRERLMLPGLATVRGFASRPHPPGVRNKRAHGTRQSAFRSDGFLANPDFRVANFAADIGGSGGGPALNSTLLAAPESGTRDALDLLG